MQYSLYDLISDWLGLNASTLATGQICMRAVVV
jgi:hypothetical protein